MRKNKINVFGNHNLTLATHIVVKNGCNSNTKSTRSYSCPMCSLHIIVPVEYSFDGMTNNQRISIITATPSATLKRMSWVPYGMP